MVDLTASTQAKRKDEAMMLILSILALIGSARFGRRPRPAKIGQVDQKGAAP